MATEQWAGFTDEDIEKIKNPVPSPDMKKSKPLKMSLFSQDIHPENPTSFSKNPIPLESATSNSNVCSTEKMQQFGGTWKIKGTNTKFSISNESLNDCTCENKNCQNYSNDLSDESSEAISNCDDKLSCSISSNADIQELEVFEERQKRAEAENARRRALINKAIMDKKKRTQAEATKLSQITAELDRLDSMLSNDVSILRNYIEKASIEFSQAEKRYLKAEKELIEAKFLLFEKMQRKEQLTEHLCAIIEQNENRKANKLVELMKQLEMETVIEDFETSDMQPIFSKYCIMNDEAYHCCQTIKPSPQNSSETESQKNQNKDLENDLAEENSEQAPTQ